MNNQSNQLNESNVSQTTTIFFYDSRDFNVEDVQKSADWDKISACLQMGLTVVIHCSKQDKLPIKITFLSSFDSKEIANDYATDISIGSDESAWVDIVWPENYQV
jgi:hypothetical protein